MTKTWHLLKAHTGPDGSPVLDLGVQLEEAQARRYHEAILTIRGASGATPLGLLITSHVELTAHLDGLAEQADPRTPAHVARVSTAAVSWLLLWRLFLDHSKHRLSAHHGDEVVREWERHTNQAYDSHAGYRVAEGLRNFVQHVAMPPLVLNRAWERDDTGRPVLSESLSLETAPLLDWDSCPRLLRADLTGKERLDFVALVADAMSAMDMLAAFVTARESPALLQALDLMADLLDAHGEPLPVAEVEERPDVPGGFKFELEPYDDLVTFIDLHRQLRKGLPRVQLTPDL